MFYGRAMSVHSHGVLSLVVRFPCNSSFRSRPEHLRLSGGAQNCPTSRLRFPLTSPCRCATSDGRPQSFKK